jgi:hypothetical protein
MLRLLGVTVREQLHRPLQVREQHRNLLALAFERGLGREDLLREVLGGVGLGRDDMGSSLLRREGLSTPAAELLARFICEPTRAARDSQRGSAFGAEASARAILMLAPGTPHPGPPAARDGYWDGSTAPGMVAESY